MIERLTPAQVRAVQDPAELPCRLSDEMPPLEGIIGQDRAMRALSFGLGIQQAGYHIYVSGLPGTGKTTAVLSYLAEVARTRPPASDWCYVHNPKDSYRPLALELPAGRGPELARDVENMVRGAAREIRAAFESDEYTARREQITSALQRGRAELLRQLETRANQAGFLLQVTPVGLFLVPMRNGRPLTDEEIQALPPAERSELDLRRAALQAEMRAALKQTRALEREARERLEQLDREVVQFAISGVVEDLTEKWAEYPHVVAYLESLRDDMTSNLHLFLEATDDDSDGPRAARQLALRKYQVNVLVHHDPNNGAPVVIEQNPTYNNLIGRIEREMHQGALITDFTNIKPGALHLANGGFLVLPAEEVLRNPFAWDGLKRALRNGHIDIEDLSDRWGFVTAKSLRPQPIPINLKVVLIGSLWLYQLLTVYDEDFPELFKVQADFDTVMDRNYDNVCKYLTFIADICRKYKLLPLDATGLAKMVEVGSRLADDQTKLSTKFGAVVSVLQEADYWARQAGASAISGEHVRQAVEERVYRSSLIYDRIKEAIARGILQVDVTGKRTGQVNGLAVSAMGEFSFGRPTRITATVGVGREGVIDIEREARLGGRIHTKGVLILGGYLTHRFGRNLPMALSARLVFEQSYSEVDGDSASAAELAALLSALSGLPLRQDLAVTGSINQYGEMQAVGGLNQKIEGFFDVCRAKGLTGQQGVIIPRSNVVHLNLREDVVEAIASGQFHIYAIDHSDELLELLTGVPVGEPDEHGNFPPGTVGGRVQARLRELVARLQDLGREQDRAAKDKAGQPGQEGDAKKPGEPPRRPPEGGPEGENGPERDGGPEGEGGREPEQDGGPEGEGRGPGRGGGPEGEGPSKPERDAGGDWGRDTTRGTERGG
ncbi:MAG: ATP-dependent protease [Bacillota bacterium]|nr:MAG: ATP-dependent protease [Bacillota bacterium]